MVAALFWETWPKYCSNSEEEGQLNKEMNLAVSFLGTYAKNSQQTTTLSLQTRVRWGHSTTVCASHGLWFASVQVAVKSPPASLLHAHPACWQIPAAQLSSSPVSHQCHVQYIYTHHINSLLSGWITVSNLPPWFILLNFFWTCASSWDRPIPFISSLISYHVIDRCRLCLVSNFI